MSARIAKAQKKRIESFLEILNRSYVKADVARNRSGVGYVLKIGKERFEFESLEKLDEGVGLALIVAQSTAERLLAWLKEDVKR